MTLRQRIDQLFQKLDKTNADATIVFAYETATRAELIQAIQAAGALNDKNYKEVAINGKKIIVASGAKLANELTRNSFAETAEKKGLLKITLHWPAN